MAQLRSAVGAFVLCASAAVLASSPLRAARVEQPAATAPDNSLTPAEVKAGWTLLFDGRTLNGWSPEGKAEWKVEDGAIGANIQPGATGNLRAVGTFADFEMLIDFWTDTPTSNSGIYFRCAPPGTAGRTCHEVNISDTSATFPTGSLVEVHSTLPDRAQTSGKWNTLRLLADGDHFVVALNGQITVDAHDGRLASGTMYLQGSAGVLRFRNIKLRRLGPAKQP